MCFFACSKDTLMTPPEPTACELLAASYADDIRPLMNSSCALSGCHVAGFSSGDFTGYAGLKAKVDDGSVMNRAIVQLNMPPSNSPGPTSLTSTEIELLSCWIEAGAPEN